MAKTFNDVVIKSQPTGSRFICGVEDTDDDRVVLVNGYYNWEKLLIDDGWELCTDEEYPQEEEPEFKAFRKGKMNYIVTEDPQFFQCYVTATFVAKAFDLTNKEDRIKLFQEVLDCRGAGQDGSRGLRPYTRNKWGYPMYEPEQGEVPLAQLNLADIEARAIEVFRR